MRSLKRNHIPIYYALYNDKIPILDEFDNETGQTTVGYEKPLKFNIRVSANKGESEDNAFGKLLDYDRVMSTTDKNFLVDEFSVLWIDKLPILKADGSTDTPFDYTVKKVAKDLNEFSYAVKKAVK